MKPEAWQLTDRATGKPLGSKAYPTLRDALDTRAKLLAVASNVSQEARQEVVERCDVRMMAR
jgi:hypothetical protein